MDKNGEAGDNRGEWTIARYGLDRVTISAWVVNYEGFASTWTLEGSWGVRPVFFLENAKMKISGKGKASDPFVVSEKTV